MLVLASLLAAGSASGASADLIGSLRYTFAEGDDTLLDLARRHDLGYAEIRLANPDLDPWLPPPDRLLTIPGQHVLPAAPREGIVINLSEPRLYFYPAGGAPQSFPIGIGREGAQTPTGRTRVVRRLADPSWRPTAGERAESPELPVQVPPGPDNPMGAYALYLGWSGYAVHGTNRPYSIGRRGSHGCIRLYPEDIATLYRQVRPGTPVTVVDQPVKLGWQDGELYLEVHPPQAALDRIENGGRPDATTMPEVDDAVLAAAGAAGARLDWHAVAAARRAQDGIPRRITLPLR